MKNNYIVYMHENKTNNKKYIGMTSLKLDIRSKNGNGYKKCPRFYSDIQKYGWENFNHYILESNLTEQEAVILEKYYIKYYQTICNIYGYNITIGGFVGLGAKPFNTNALGHKLDEKVKEKMRLYSSDNKSVLCIETGIIYYSMSNAARELGLDQSRISKCCRGIRNKTGGYHWRYC